MKRLKKVIRLICLICFAIMAGMGIAFVPFNAREKYQDYQVRKEQVDAREEDSEHESDEDKGS